MRDEDFSLYNQRKGPQVGHAREVKKLIAEFERDGVLTEAPPPTAAQQRLATMPRLRV